MTEAPTAAQVAGMLSPAAIERILGEEDGNCAFGPAMQFVRYALIVGESDDGEGWSWSPLGLAVRAILMEQDRG